MLNSLDFIGFIIPQKEEGDYMKKYEPDAIRNVGIFSHGGEGKTSIVEAMLFLAGENTRLGSVNDGTSLMDYEPERNRTEGNYFFFIRLF